MLRKVLSFSLAFALIISLSACSGKKTASSDATSGSSDTSETVTGSPEDSSTVTGDTTASSEATVTNSATKSAGGSVVTQSGGKATTKKAATGTTAAGTQQEVIAIFGGSSDPNQAKLKSMGQQGWYPMYSIKTNINVTGSASFDLNSLKKCQQTISGLWKPNETVTDKDGNKLTGSWFAIRKDGFCCGDTAFTAALKWVAPTDGTYKIQIRFSGGTSSGFAEKGYYQGTGDNKYWVPAADGVYMSAYINNKKVVGVDSWAGAGHRIDQTDKTFKDQKLKAGQSVIIVADTKGNGGWDDPWWFVYAERTGNY